MSRHDPNTSVGSAGIRHPSTIDQTTPRATLYDSDSNDEDETGEYDDPDENLDDTSMREFLAANPNLSPHHSDERWSEGERGIRSSRAGNNTPRTNLPQGQSSIGLITGPTNPPNRSQNSQGNNNIHHSNSSTERQSPQRIQTFGATSYRVHAANHASDSGNDLHLPRSAQSVESRRRASSLFFRDSPRRYLDDPRRGERRHMSHIVVPRWQPDSEVSACPICRSQFSWLNRKHHCRKCGRVVCSSCSPHRILLPHQFIVRPPMEEPTTSRARSSTGPSQASVPSSTSEQPNSDNLGGGERVRLCNPCVPDPSTPLQPVQDDEPQHRAERGSHGRSASALYPSHSISTNSTPSSRSRYEQPLPNIREIAASRQASAQNQPWEQNNSNSSSNSNNQYRSSTVGLPNYSQHSHDNDTSNLLRHLPRGNMPSHSRANTSGGRGQSHTPRPAIPEEDQCPVCHQELPSSSLENSEALRDSHIRICIEQYITGGTPPLSSHLSSSAPITIVNSRPAAVGPSNSQTRRTGYVPYKATEKDCIEKSTSGEDIAAECTICFEEYEEGADMARLECLCRYHLHCIRKWFSTHPGQCPVHQYDAPGN